MAVWAVIQAGGEFWPTSLNGWASLILPLGAVLALMGAGVKHFVIDPINKRITDDEQELADETTERVEGYANLQKNIRGVRRLSQTYIGRVDLLSDSVRDSSRGNDGLTKDVGRLEARVQEAEKRYHSVEQRLLTLENLIQFQVMEMLKRIEKELHK